MEPALLEDREDLKTQSRQWLEEVNNERLGRATGETPEQRRQHELPRLRPLRVRVTPERLALHIPIQVGDDRRGELRRARLCHAAGGHGHGPGRCFCTGTPALGNTHGPVERTSALSQERWR